MVYMSVLVRLLEIYNLLVSMRVGVLVRLLGLKFVVPRLQGTEKKEYERSLEYERSFLSTCLLT